MRTRTAILSWAALLFLSANAHGGTFLYVDGDPGEPISGDTPRLFDPDDGLFDSNRQNFQGAHLSFQQLVGGDALWVADFSANGSGATELTPGLFLGAQRNGFQAEDRPGLLVHWAQQPSCNQSFRGTFQVYEIAFGANESITSFAADFVQYCNSPRKLVGAIRLNSTTAPATIVDVDADGAADIADVCPGLADSEQLDADFDGIGDACDDSTEASFLAVVSQPNDPIGVGQTLHLSSGNAAMYAAADPNGAIRVELESDSDSEWHLVFANPGGGPLTVGSFEDAQQFPDQGGAPGLDVSAGDACAGLAGRFTVRALEYDEAGALELFAVDFEQRCSGASGSLVGKLRWRSSFLANPNDLDGDGWLDKHDNCPGLANPVQADADLDGRGDGCGLGKPEQACVNQMNAGGAALSATQTALSLRCLSAAVKEPSAGTQACLTADAAGKFAKSVLKLEEREVKLCTGLSPSFGYAPAATLEAAAQTEGEAWVGDLFGPNLGTAVLPRSDKRGVKCQQTVMKATGKLVGDLWKLTLAEKKLVLDGQKSFVATDADTLGELLLANLAGNAAEKLAKKVAGYTSAITRNCATGAGLAAAFPGCAPADPSALAACSTRAARCRFCRMLEASDALDLDCELFDDALANASCAD